jgi:toxin ParE1/3/4
LPKVRYSRLARKDLLDIWRYIESRNSEAIADRVCDRINETCRLLAQHPRLGRARPEVAEGARSLVIERWLAFYRLVPDGVQVVRIVDGARDLAEIEWTFED